MINVSKLRSHKIYLGLFYLLSEFLETARLKQMRHWHKYTKKGRKIQSHGLNSPKNRQVSISLIWNWNKARKKQVLCGRHSSYNETMIYIISSPWNFYYSPELRSQQEQGFQICSVFIQPSQETHTSVWGTWYPHKISSVQTHVIFPCQETRNVYLALQVFHCVLLSTHQVPEKQCENSSPELYTCAVFSGLLHCDL